MQTSIRSLSRLMSAILLTMALAFSGSVALADDDGDDDDGQGEPTAYLYEGNTDDLGSAVLVDEIDDLDNDDDDDDDNDWDKLGNGQPRPEGLLSTEDDLEDDLDLTIESLVDGDYMIVVHADDSTDSPVLAAGEIDGEIQDGTILIELDEVDGSGFEGRSFIHPDDDDDDDDDDSTELEVTVGVYPTGSVEPLNVGTPAS